ncbi:MAG: LysR family transcriptional regulator [Deltaproteobacteria bacterium]|nr:LysR family transcriptional regulator [Deltaproteobacteria bacterium]
MNTTIDLVAVLVAVGETASFSAAAQRLGVTTGTVSRSIARLEALAGAQLVHRTTRHVSLSAAGQALFERSASHVRSIEAALTNLPERQQEPAGTLCLTAPPDLGVTLLPDVIARFVSLYPQVRVRLDLGNRKVDLVAEGFDLALRASTGKEKDSSLVRRRIMLIDLRFYASPSYLARRGSPREQWASDHDWIGFFAASRRLRVPAGFEPRVASNDMLFVREATRAGIGIGLLPNFVADPLVAAGSLVPVLTRVRLSTASFIMLQPAGPAPRKVTAFREVLLGALNAGKAV